LYCLECGTKIDDKELQCPRCGSLVVDMKARIAAAEEQIVYTDAVSPSSTTKLPLVKDRSYTDKDGNPLDPSKKVEVPEVNKPVEDLTAIPELGAKDPFVTMPMQRIVSSRGQVVADVDRDAKTYKQGVRKNPFPWKPFLGAILIIALIVAAAYFAPQIKNAWDGFVADLMQQQQTAPSPTAEKKQEQEQVPDAATSQSTKKPYSEADFVNDLSSAYKDLASWRTDVDTRVSDLEGYYLVTKSSTRQAYADKCTATIEEITASREELASKCQQANVAQSSEAYKKYQKIDELHGYLLDRLGVISQSWEISLSYSSPSSHGSEILAPITSDLKNGNSVSEAAFDALYPEADPAA
jgi:hypothetical protein